MRGRTERCQNGYDKMPTYTFENSKTGEVYTKEMKIAEREGYLADNPDIIQVLTPPVSLDPVGLGIQKPPADFQKYVLGRVQEKTGQSMEKRWTINREV